MSELPLSYISDEQGKVTGVIVPIEIGEEIASELETAYLLRSKAMKQCLLDAKQPPKGIPFEDALEKLGI